VIHWLFFTCFVLVGFTCIYVLICRHCTAKWWTGGSHIPSQVATYLSDIIKIYISFCVCINSINDCYSLHGNTSSSFKFHCLLPKDMVDSSAINYLLTYLLTNLTFCGSANLASGLLVRF